MTEHGQGPSATLGLGCATVFGLPTARERRAVFECAVAEGIRHFDVAPMYGLGRAEPELGAFLRAHGEGVRVATKFGIAPSAAGRLAGLTQGPARRLMRRSPGLQQQVKQSGDGPRAGWVGRVLYRPENYSPAAARASLERSLRCLRRDRVDVFLVHEPALAFGSIREDLFAYLESARDAGEIGHWGFAGDLSEIAAGISALTPAPGVLQHPYDIAAGPQGPPPSAGAERITFGFLSRGLPPSAAAVAADRALATRVAEVTGAVAPDRSALAALLVKDACAAAPGGTVLVSTTRPDHLRGLVRAAASFSDAEKAAVGLLRRAVTGVARTP